MPHHFTDDEKSKLDEYLAKKTGFKKRRRKLLQELEEVEASIIEMRRKYGRVYNARNPVLTLPVEVTCLIFTFAQLPESRIDFPAFDSGDTYEEEGFLMEVVVSQVCQRWRSISLGFPKLWTDFQYQAIKQKKRRTVDVQPLQRFATYVERSAALPLHIWFNFQPDCGNPDNSQLVEKTIQHAQRWQRFTMYSNDATLMQPLHLLRDLSMPMLEYLTLVPGDEDLDRDVITSVLDPCLFKGGAPKLTYLMLGANSVFSLPPLSNITILRIEHLMRNFPVFELTPFLELLSLPSLNRLSLAGNIIAPFHASRTTHMPNLKSFRVVALDATWDLLASIRAPQLDTLIIHLWDVHAGPIPVLDKGYAFPALNKLYLLSLNLLDPHIVPALTHMTSQATNVLLHEYKDIRIILYEGSAGVVWPRLKTIRCNIGTRGAVDQLITFAKNRRKDLFTFRILDGCLEELRNRFPERLKALREVSLVKGDYWYMDEPFWPDDIGRYGPYYHSEENCFRLDF